MFIDMLVANQGSYLKALGRTARVHRRFSAQPQQMFISDYLEVSINTYGEFERAGVLPSRKPLLLPLLDALGWPRLVADRAAFRKFVVNSPWCAIMDAITSSLVPQDAYEMCGWFPYPAELVSERSADCPDMRAFLAEPEAKIDLDLRRLENACRLASGAIDRHWLTLRNEAHVQECARLSAELALNLIYSKVNVIEIASNAHIPLAQAEEFVRRRVASPETLAQIACTYHLNLEFPSAVQGLAGHTTLQ